MAIETTQETLVLERHCKASVDKSTELFNSSKADQQNSAAIGEETEENSDMNINERLTAPIALKGISVVGEGIIEESGEKGINSLTANTTLNYLQENSSKPRGINRATTMTSLNEFLVLERLCDISEGEHFEED